MWLETVRDRIQRAGNALGIQMVCSSGGHLALDFSLLGLFRLLPIFCGDGDRKEHRYTRIACAGCEALLGWGGGLWGNLFLCLLFFLFSVCLFFCFVFRFPPILVFLCLFLVLVLCLFRFSVVDFRRCSVFLFRPGRVLSQLVFNPFQSLGLRCFLRIAFQYISQR